MKPFEPIPTPAIQYTLDQSPGRITQQTSDMARSLISLIGFRDQYTSSHSARVANYVRAIATQLGLSDEETETAVFAASVHDIGKIGIPDHILLKPGKLSEEEFAWIQKYPEWGWMTLRHLDGFQQAALLVLHQHERVDGSGYPNKLRGEEIPLGSRIITVADSFDALTTDRPYHRAFSHAEALAELIRCSGSQFDPEVVNAFRLSLERQMAGNELS
ncbi:MAG TPA: HD-GYP domain-containing protein [Gemmatimonadaceae bacterium]